MWNVDWNCWRGMALIANALESAKQFSSHECELHAAFARSPDSPAIVAIFQQTLYSTWVNGVSRATSRPKPGATAPVGQT